MQYISLSKFEDEGTLLFRLYMHVSTYVCMRVYVWI